MEDRDFSSDIFKVKSKRCSCSCQVTAMDHMSWFTLAWYSLDLLHSCFILLSAMYRVHDAPR